MINADIAKAIAVVATQIQKQLTASSTSSILTQILEKVCRKNSWHKVQRALCQGRIPSAAKSQKARQAQGNGGSATAIRDSALRKAKVRRRKLEVDVAAVCQTLTQIRQHRHSSTKRKLVASATAPVVHSKVVVKRQRVKK